MSDDVRPFIYDFDHHVCVACRGRRSHDVDQVPVEGADPPEFMLRCTTCGAEEGPYAGVPGYRARVRK